ncbi:MAG: hypothetical protein JWO92_503 [Chitinophagaceae bacterium]|nr:hypothetical protein [Chitinophagaceae bacterium]
MPQLTISQKISLLPITEKLVADIATGNEEILNQSKMSDIFLDTSIPQDKKDSFTEILSDIIYNQLIKFSKTKGHFEKTKKWKWGKFYNFIGWKNLGWLVATLMSGYALYLQYISVKSDTPKEVTSDQQKTNPLSPQGSDTSFHLKELKTDLPKKTLTDSVGLTKLKDTTGTKKDNRP